MHQIRDVLYICNENIQLHREGKAALACMEGGKKIHVPLCSVGQIISFSYHPATCEFLELCAKEGIGFSAVSPSGRLRFRVIGKTHGNVFLRQQQYQQMDDPEKSLPMAKALMHSKLQNSVHSMRLFSYDHPEVNQLRGALDESCDTVRFYLLGNHYDTRIERIGCSTEDFFPDEGVL